MYTEPLERCIDAQAEALVFLDPKDLPALAGLHQLFQDAAVAATAEELPRLKQAMDRAADLTQAIILDEVSDIAAALGVLQRTIESVQGAIRSRLSMAQVEFPQELGMDSVAAAPASNAAAPKPQAPKAPAPTVQPDLASELLTPFDPSTGDADLLREFVNEASEHLENAEVALLALETNPGDTESINAVFRAFHTIKGVAGMLQVRAMQALAHESENLLDKVRKGELSVSTGIMDISLESVDALRGLIKQLDEALSGGVLTPSEDLPVLVERVRAAASGNTPVSLGPPPSTEGEPLGVLLVKRGVMTHRDVAQALFKQFATMPPREIGELLIAANAVTRSRVEDALELQQATPDKMLGEILIEQGWTTEEAVEAALAKQKAPVEAPKLGEVIVRNGLASARDVAEELRGQQQARSTGGTAQHEIVKVDAARLDHLVDMIGELVIAQSMVTQSEDFRRNLSQDVLRHLYQLDRITRDLQETGMSLRMVSLRSTFQKIARLARDLSQKTGKPVDFTMAGEDTEVDKSMVDRIGDPLVHMIRNALDHGLESSADERIANGKPAQGRVQLRAFHRQGSLVIEIEDDGRGLDRDRILAKAHERGLDRVNDMMSDAEVWQLIFEPGFSTAAVVTDVSGRGVGMDVVRKNVEAMRGRIEITSSKGQGSRFSIILPLTLAIIDGMVVSVGEERYIVPTLSVTKSIQAKTGELLTMLGRQEVLNLQGELIPIVRLAELFKVPGAILNTTEAITVIVEAGNRKVGLLVDRILGQQQIVIKSLGQSMREVPGISGGAIMSDGNIGLILDVSGISALVQESPEPQRSNA